MEESICARQGRLHWLGGVPHHTSACKTYHINHITLSCDLQTRSVPTEIYWYTCRDLQNIEIKLFIENAEVKLSTRFRNLHDTVVDLMICDDHFSSVLYGNEVSGLVEKSSWFFRPGLVEIHAKYLTKDSEGISTNSGRRWFKLGQTFGGPWVGWVLSFFS